MKRRDFIRLTGMGTLGLLFTGCGIFSDKAASPAVAAENAWSAAEGIKGKKILVAFFSRKGDNYEVGYIEKGNTHILADMIAEELPGADMFEIKTVKEYAADYRACTEEAKAEKAQDARPQLVSHLVERFAHAGLYLYGKLRLAGQDGHPLLHFGRRRYDRFGGQGYSALCQGRAGKAARFGLVRQARPAGYRACSPASKEMAE